MANRNVLLVVVDSGTEGEQWSAVEGEEAIVAAKLADEARACAARWESRAARRGEVREEAETADVGGGTEVAGREVVEGAMAVGLAGGCLTLASS